MILLLQADETCCACFLPTLRAASLNGSPTYTLAFGKASATFLVALWTTSLTRFFALSSIRYLRRWSLLYRRDRFTLPDCAAWIDARFLFRHCTVALASRPLTRTTRSPSVAATIVFTPRSTPTTGPGLTSRSGIRQTRS